MVVVRLGLRGDGGALVDVASAKAEAEAAVDLMARLEGVREARTAPRAHARDAAAVLVGVASAVDAPRIVAVGVAAKAHAEVLFKVRRERRQRRRWWGRGRERCGRRRWWRPGGRRWARWRRWRRQRRGRHWRERWRRAGVRAGGPAIDFELADRQIARGLCLHAPALRRPATSQTTMMPSEQAAGLVGKLQRHPLPLCAVAVHREGPSRGRHGLGAAAANREIRGDVAHRGTHVDFKWREPLHVLQGVAAVVDGDGFHRTARGHLHREPRTTTAGGASFEIRSAQREWIAIDGRARLPLSWIEARAQLGPQPWQRREAGERWHRRGWNRLR